MESERLLFREYVDSDFQNLKEIISDPETMKYYSSPYDDNGVRRWIEWNKNNYQTFGFGLWVLIDKKTNNFIGDCGITMQIINNKICPEIGYHINKKYWNMGYASEASKVCKDYLFLNTPFKEVYSYMNKDNIASIKVAINNGMKEISEYIEDGVLHKVYRIRKEEWLNVKFKSTI